MAEDKGNTTPRKDVLGKMSPHERAEILQSLLKKHPELKPEAEALAMERLSSPSVEAIADAVLFAVTCLDMDDINQRAGSQPWGYVEPCEAAREVLAEAIEEVVTDMKRRMALGLTAAAETICCGLVMGLHMAQDEGSDGDPLAWDPDFPIDGACDAVAELIRACPAKDRRTVRDRLVEVVGDLVPDWHGMLRGAADRAMPAK